MEPQTRGITAEIGVFSGRPNPSIQLEGAPADQLLALTEKTIGVRATHPPPPARLGSYHGFVVRIPAETARKANLPVEFAIYEGVITERRGRQQNHWRDTANLEEFLISEAYRQGQGDLLRKVGIER